MTIGLIDGDSMVYILAHNHQEHRDIKVMEESVHGFMEDLFLMGCLDVYAGALKPTEGTLFREKVYSMAPYKGNRTQEVSEHYAFWKPVITGILIDHYGFVSIPGLEADDIVAYLAEQVYAWDTSHALTVFSPDKDLRQFAGFFINYGRETADVIAVDANQAAYNFWYQMLVGDSSDNIKGIPGTGEKKAKEILRGLDSDKYREVVLDKYTRHFGEYYGPKIFEETYDTLRLVTTSHRQFPFFKDQLEALHQTVFKKALSRQKRGLINELNG
jgi:DNA polymerase-1